MKKLKITSNKVEYEDLNAEITDDLDLYFKGETNEYRLVKFSEYSTYSTVGVRMSRKEAKKVAQAITQIEAQLVTLN